jgi:hypothetical protein
MFLLEFFSFVTEAKGEVDKQLLGDCVMNQNHITALSIKKAIE